MKIIKPTTINDTIFDSSNVTEDDYDEWLIGTVYTAGDYCIVTGTTHKIYEALVNVTGGLSPELDVLEAVPKWLEISSTNRWKMFDSKIESQTENAGFIETVLTPGRISAIAFINIDAAWINLIMTDPTEGEVYNETITLEATEIVQWGPDEQWAIGEQWQGGSFQDLTSKVAIKFDLPPYVNTSIKITIAASSATAKCGMVILGMHKDLGITNYTPKIGITDYSVKTVDAFGNYSITVRSFSKKAEVTFTTDIIKHVQVLKLIALYRARPLLWILNETYNSTIVYGFYKEFTMTINGIEIARSDISIEGLT